MHKKIKIDICTTATLRPEILERTLKSFKKYLFNDDKNFEYRLIINVDWSGPLNSAITVIEIAKKYFENIKYRVGIPSHFPTAFKWVWSQIDSDYVFHLEDDWELQTFAQIKLIDMVRLMEKHKDLMILRLSAFRTTNDTVKCWNKFFPWNGEFYECPKNLVGGLAFSGHPSLIKSEWIYNVRKHLNGISNPEKQIKWRDPNIGPYILKFRYGVYSDQNCPPSIVDIGRRWMILNGWRKKGNKALFKTWEKVI